MHRRTTEPAAGRDPVRQANPHRTTTASPPTSPPLDLDGLGRDLWRRFERQIRIERERSGRG
ncbi:hypothetical protein ACGFJ7_12375 [Actinoplanes sp. NPDC048988]|uniref:hypothetical protein n=1 Tax=Actinoplanes sp. NPDC048988 TaxID=3363901 RepID=UPI003724309D